ncbi:MAG: aldehyde dehydrogenase family protein, partial [Geminicoccaceae bacterium]
MHTQLLINGRFLAGEGAAEPILDPATGETIATVPEASLSQVEAAVAAADAAFPAWARTTPQERSLKLLQVADAIEKESEAFAALESRNTGKPPA